MAVRFSLDRLPAHAAVEAEIAGDEPERVRFVAVRYAEDNCTELARSAPSGWFMVPPGEPVVLSWDAFAFEERP